MKMKVSKPSLLSSTIMKATSDAVFELLLHQGIFLSEIDIDSIGENRKIEYTSMIRSLYSDLPESDKETFAKLYFDQWTDTYFFIQEKLTLFL